MFYSIAFHFANNITGHCHIDPDQRDIYVYGSELFLSTFLGVLSIILISGLSGHFFSGFIFLLIFISIRLFSGGFHASTYLRCFILSNLSYFVAFLISCLLLKVPSVCGFLLLALSDFVIFAFSPIRNDKHPLSEKTYSKNKVIARKLTLFESIVITLCYVFTLDRAILSISSASLFSVASLMLFEKIKKKGVI